MLTKEGLAKAPNFKTKTNKKKKFFQQTDLDDGSTKFFFLPQTKRTDSLNSLSQCEGIIKLN
jgi:hypothetical protein